MKQCIDNSKHEARRQQRHACGASHVRHALMLAPAVRTTSSLSLQHAQMVANCKIQITLQHTGASSGHSSRHETDVSGMSAHLTGASPCSTIGSASMSERSATMGALPVPISAMSPVPDFGRLWIHFDMHQRLLPTAQWHAQIMTAQQTCSDDVDIACRHRPVLDAQIR